MVFVEQLWVFKGFKNSPFYQNCCGHYVLIKHRGPVGAGSISSLNVSNSFSPAVALGGAIFLGVAVPSRCLQELDFPLLGSSVPRAGLRNISSEVVQIPYPLGLLKLIPGGEIVERWIVVWSQRLWAAQEMVQKCRFCTGQRISRGLDYPPAILFRFLLDCFNGNIPSCCLDRLSLMREHQASAGALYSTRISQPPSQDFPPINDCGCLFCLLGLPCVKGKSFLEHAPFCWEMTRTGCAFG